MVECDCGFVSGDWFVAFGGVIFAVEGCGVLAWGVVCDACVSQTMLAVSWDLVWFYAILFKWIVSSVVPLPVRSWPL